MFSLCSICCRISAAYAQFSSALMMDNDYHVAKRSAAVVYLRERYFNDLLDRRLLLREAVNMSRCAQCSFQTDLPEILIPVLSNQSDENHLMDLYIKSLQCFCFSHVLARDIEHLRGYVSQFCSLCEETERRVTQFFSTHKLQMTTLSLLLRGKLTYIFVVILFGQHEMKSTSVQILIIA